MAGREAPHATFACSDLGSFCRLDELGLQVVGQLVTEEAPAGTLI
jgi:hypothetical protein